MNGDNEGLRQLLIDELRAAAAARVCYEAGCTYGELIRPYLVRHLAVLADDADPPGSWRVVGLDDAGRVRQGPSGPMTPDQLMAQLVAEMPYITEPRPQ